MDILKKLNLPDYLSLTALFWAWLSVLLILAQKSNYAILVMLLAFICDLLDGYVARRLGLESKLGREIDSYVDIFTYLVFSALFYYFFLSPNQVAGIVVGFLILVFGGLRLIRFNQEGIRCEHGRKFYRGITVVHINAVVLLFYFLQELTPWWEAWFSASILTLVAPLMLSNHKSYKVDKPWLFAIIIALVALLALYLEYAY